MNQNHIGGTLLMLDGATPHVAVPVDAVRDGVVVKTALSNEQGKYQLTNLKPGVYQMRCQVLGGYVYYVEERRGKRESQKAGRSGDGTVSDVSISLRIDQGETLKNIDFRFAPFKKGTWRNYDTLDGLAHNAVRKIYRDTDGMMWFGTEGGGVSRYDGKEFVIAVTNRDLVEEVEAGHFREDLFFRLSEFPIHIPSLRERSEDIPPLAENFLQEHSQDQKKELNGFAPGVFEVLQNYHWPGNVRELRNAIRLAAALAEEGERIQTYYFSSQVTQGESLIQEILSERVTYGESVDRFRRRLVERALQECNGNRTQAAKMLGVKRPNLVKLIKRLGVDL